uniref:EGF-like domain-containing protein n=1 Tax=Angiostrongylus cantonensis TaxID=6313 RepID=A0A0K0DA05_ANGCA
SPCLNGGFLNETDGDCICLHHYTGKHCERPVGSLTSDRFKGRCICEADYVGDHCESRCHGWVNLTTGESTNSIDQLKRVYTLSPLFCLELLGYMGLSCATCDPSSGRECEIPAKRRGAVNSRLTLSGLSFCMITIGLLCVTARYGSNVYQWNFFILIYPRFYRCRHDLMCGGSWIPRDRALLVAPGRSAYSFFSRGRRLATPPPNYTSVDNLVDDQLPPTYEEATRYLENSPTNATVQTLEAKEVSPEMAETSTNITTTSVPTQTTQPDENITTTTTPTANIFSASS